MTSCKQCYQNSALTQAESSNESPTCPSLMQGKDLPIPVSAGKVGKVGNCSNPSASTVTPKHSYKVKTASSNLATKTKPQHWGVIWRKQDEDTGDFRFKHILLKGNPDRDSLRPSCRLCCKPYDPYLMYIRCETCTYWYHAEAVKLEESKIFEVVGFKCCRCRRIRIPIFPYLDPKSKRHLEEKRMCARTSKMDSRGIELYSGFISEVQKDEDMATPAVPLGTTSLEDDKPRVFVVEELTEHFPVGDCERNAEAISAPGQRKQPVRTHIENETDLESSSELSTALGRNIVVCEEEMPTHVESVGRDTSRNSSEEAGHECKDMEFEPQTCFSFNELLASDDLSPSDGVDSSATLTKNVETSSRILPDKNANTSYVKHEPAISTISAAAFAVPCKMCKHKESCPDLCCEICDIWIHRHCSPWNEEEPGEDNWKCGNCREWR
ncbi:hypothetical protein RND71_006601 [Anisodus tanguticus]|uniref:Uncharacterized protein n=1 Tax=Anisodus tanguticus TaxID=243964 RepID=A0AAE1VVS8_9SOLA|nr:hypothetical protein RND71_006601 [Anisodus tanguticus]